MSLLLDALKRAEDAKRAKQNEAPKADDTANLIVAEPDSVAPPPEVQQAPLIQRARAVSELSLEALPPIKPLPSTGHAQTAKPTTNRIVQATKPTARAAATPHTDLSADEVADLEAAQESIQRDVAKNVFAAKQNAAQILTTASAKTGAAKWLPFVLALIFLAIGAAAWYVWREVSTISNSSLAPSLATNAGGRAPTPAASQANSATIGPAAANTGQLNTAAPGAKTTTTPKSFDATAETRALPPLLPPPAKQTPLPKLALIPSRPTEAGVTLQEDLTEREMLAKRLKSSGGNRITKESPVSLKLSQSIAPSAINPSLLAGYAALNRGDYAEAKARYGEALSATPFSIDALLGLATAAARTGESTSATKHYRRALEIDPRNSTAISGLLAVSGETRPEALEAELKTWVLKTPDSAALHFSLGNLYAGEKRWSEAQQAYFEAYRIDSANADYLYNLGVSLDQLNQTKIALDYYQKALNQATKTGGQFDRAAVQRRIRELGESGANLKAN